VISRIHLSGAAATKTTPQTKTPPQHLTQPLSLNLGLRHRCLVMPSCQEAHRLAVSAWPALTFNTGEPVEPRSTVLIRVDRGGQVSVAADDLVAVWTMLASPTPSRWVIRWAASLPVGPCLS
jgi:hypothetical protein